MAAYGGVWRRMAANDCSWRLPHGRKVLSGDTRDLRPQLDYSILGATAPYRAEIVQRCVRVRDGVREAAAKARRPGRSHPPQVAPPKRSRSRRSL